MHRHSLALAALLALAPLGGAGAPPRIEPQGSTSTPEFAAFVDRYLDDWARRHPSIAAGNGIHDHDDRLDDFSAAGIAAEIAALKRDRDALRAFDPRRLTRDEDADRTILLGIIDGWLLEQETLQNWRRNPMLYASALNDGVHGLMTMESTPVDVRARRVISKLRAAPKLLADARANIANPPRIFAERGAAMFRSAEHMLGRDLDLAFASLESAALRDSVRRAADATIPLVAAYATYLEKEVAPRATGDWKVGAENLARRYRAEELIDTPLERMIAVGERELKRGQEEFRQAGAKLAPGRDPLDAWKEIRKDHPKMGEVVAATQRVVDSLTAFAERKGLATLPPGERVIVAPAQPFSLGFASMHASPPLEKVPVKSFYYITDAQPAMSAAEQEGWLERYNYASLANTSAHEAVPGHWLHSTYMRRTPGKVRRIWIGLNPFPQPSSGQDGWAHYAEQMVLDEGFGNGDPRLRMAQVSDALTRICRLLSGVRLHTGQWTLEDAQRCFERDAYVAAPAAKREAERATYDPTYGGYFLGKMALMKLRRDWQARQGAAFDLRAFHERIMTNGIAPVRAHRQLLLPGDRGELID